MHFAFKLAHERVYYCTEILVPTCAIKLAENQNTQCAPTWSIFGRVVEKAEAEQQEDDCSPGDFS